MDCLPVGTPVYVKDLRAVITAVTLEKDQHNLPIYVHTVRYPNGRETKVNYSFITVPQHVQREPL